jgi:triosephosphate isomerase
MIRSSGAAGTLMNHSEHRMIIREIGETVELCKGIDLVTVVCADTAESAARIAAFSPEFIAVEPPELIGGDISVTTANPDIIEKTVDSVRAVNRHIPVLCGAGIKTGEDVRNALELGAGGVLLASGVVKAKDPVSALLDLTKHI